MWYVYMIQNSNSKEYYFGFTSNLEKRLESHNTGKNPSTKRLQGIWELVYYEAFQDESLARERERKIKSHGNAKREIIRRAVKNTQNGAG
jgi:putative endonuclease